MHELVPTEALTPARAVTGKQNAQRSEVVHTAQRGPAVAGRCVTRPPGADDALGRLLAAAVIQRAAPSSGETMMAKAVIQRELDDSFGHAGTCTADQTAQCKAFAEKVTAFVEQAARELKSGSVSAWGVEPRYTAFLGLLLTQHSSALVHIGNAIEERVYALMTASDMKMPWVPQRAEAMGGASRPDIVVTVGPGKFALIDITSESGHILRKAGGWTTSTKYVYVAEALYPPFLKADLATIRANIQKGGVSAAELREMERAVAAAKAEAAAHKAAETKRARQLLNESGTFTDFANKHHDGNKSKAIKWLRDRGISNVKGAPKRRSRVKERDAFTHAAGRRAAKKHATHNKEKRDKAIADARAKGLLPAAAATAASAAAAASIATLDDEDDGLDVVDEEDAGIYSGDDTE